MISLVHMNTLWIIPLTHSISIKPFCPGHHAALRAFNSTHLILRVPEILNHYYRVNTTALSKFFH